MLSFLFFCAQVVYVLSDLPIHCLHWQTRGDWVFEISQLSKNVQSCGYKAPDKNLDHFYPDVSEKRYSVKVVSKRKFTLKSPNSVLEKGKVVGTWTMIYDEGIHVRLRSIKHKKYLSFFAFMKYLPLDPQTLLTDHLSDYVSHCDATRIGWVHAPYAKLHGCFTAKRKSITEPVFKWKISRAVSHRVLKPTSKLQLNSRQSVMKSISHEKDGDLFKMDYEFVEKINSDTSKLWKARVHKQFMGKTNKEMAAMLGRPNYQPMRKVNLTLLGLKSEEKDTLWRKRFPKSLDWRNHGGINFMNPVSNQGACGSCYAVSSTDVFSTRFNIFRYRRDKKKANKKIKKLQKIKFSAQQILACDNTNQGCDGGYPYLVGKLGHETGFVTEACLDYKGRDNVKCGKIFGNCPKARRYKLKDYGYVGGYFGAGSEKDLIKELQDGPVVVAFDAQKELFSYMTGVYHCQKDTLTEAQKEKANVGPWVRTTHAVVLAGYGSLKVGRKTINYWLIKNSWGELWGDQGYFKMLRGSDTCGVESQGVTGTFNG